MMMPGISGIEVHRWLVENNTRLARHFAFITGGAFTPHAREYLSQVSNRHLAKPFEISSVKKTVDEMVSAAQREG